MDRIEEQLKFLIEIDKVKNILRQSLVCGERRENDAEHSWHMSICSLVLKEYFNQGDFNMETALKMVLIHDIVEIYAGDVPAFSIFSKKDKEEKEYKSAKKIFSLLPNDQEIEFFNLWLEFEKGESNESKFAILFDRFQGFLQNLTSDGHTWKKYNVTMEAVLNRMEPIKLYAPKVFENIVLKSINEYKEKGIIK